MDRLSFYGRDLEDEVEFKFRQNKEPGKTKTYSKLDNSISVVKDPKKPKLEEISASTSRQTTKRYYFNERRRLDGKPVEEDETSEIKIVKTVNPDYPEVDLKSLNTLEVGCMLNDTAVEFYMNRLFIRLNVKFQKRIHKFNSFFYSKLKQAYKSNDSNSNKSILRWDKSVKIFDKDWIVIPICDSSHWLLVIICYPRKAPSAEEPVVIKDSPPSTDHRVKEASILIFDSLNHRYLPQFTAPIRQFLSYRWEFERPTSEKRLFTDRNLLKEYIAKGPRQKNIYDCGIYLLNSLEQFLKDPETSTMKIKRNEDLSKQWDIDARSKRIEIRDYMRDLFSNSK